MYLQKSKKQKNWHLDGSMTKIAGSGSRSIGKRSESVPKCHGTTTLVPSYLLFRRSLIFSSQMNNYELKGG
jgi:hypothetical protein